METDTLAKPDLVRLWVIGGTNNVVRWLELLSAALFVYELTGSGLAVAAVSAARTLPMLLFGAFAGVISETTNRKRIMMTGMVITASMSITIGSLAYAGLAEPWQVGLASFICGSVWSTDMSSRRRMVGDAAGPDLLGRAIAVDSLAGATTRMIGPLLGAVVYNFVGLPGAYALTTLLSASNFFLAWPIHHTQITRRQSLGGALRDLLDGMRSAREIPQVMAVIGVTMAMNCFVFSYSAVVAPIARGLFDAPTALVGFLAAAESAGALLAGLAMAWRMPAISPRLLMIGGSVTFAASLVLMPLVGNFWLACLILLIGGTGTAAFSNMQTLLVMNNAPPSMRSRLLGLITVCIGTGPLGQLVIGALADAFGLRIAVEVMAISGVVTILAMGVLWKRAEAR